RRARPSFGSRLLGAPDESPLRRRVRVQTLLTGSIVVANVLGALGVAALILLLVPDRDPLSWLDVVAVGIYLLLAVVVGLWWGTRTGLSSLTWLLEGRGPDEGEQRRTLRVPLRLVALQAVFWVAAAGFFSVVNRDLS